MLRLIADLLQNHSEYKRKSAYKPLLFRATFNKNDITEFADGLKEEDRSGRWLANKSLTCNLLARPEETLSKEEKQTLLEVRYHIALKRAADRADLNLDKAYDMFQRYAAPNECTRSGFNDVMFKGNNIPAYLYKMKQRIPWLIFIEEDAADMDKMVDVCIEQFCDIREGFEDNPGMWQFRYDSAAQELLKTR